jgi:hypothetical protein
MLFAYPYETERASFVVFCIILLCVGYFASRGVVARSLTVNSLTLMVLLNAVLCLMVYVNDSRLVVSYFHVSFGEEKTPWPMEFELFSLHVASSNSPKLCIYVLYYVLYYISSVVSVVVVSLMGL